MGTRAEIVGLSQELFFKLILSIENRTFEWKEGALKSQWKGARVSV